MPALCFSNRQGPYVNELVPLLLAVCIFLTCVSHVELLKVGGGEEDGSPINVNVNVDGAGISEKNYSESFRIGQVCSGRDISVSQSMIYTLPNGIPAYDVEIKNTCATRCAISNIHISCGSFASAIEVDPKTFRRVAYNDCLVKDGGKLAAGDSVSFNYANNFKYPLAVASVKCDS